MIFHPAILALLAASAINAAVLLAGALFAVHLLRHWDLASGHERQIRLERQTYLAATAIALVLAIQFVALLLFVYNAERMSVLFTGAMCATGTLNVNAYGFPTLILKIAGFFLAVVWLALNQADNLARDYPLIRRKYALLIAIAPVFLAEAVVQALYFLNLNPNVITSCCGSLFSDTGAGTAAELAALPARPALIAFYAVLFATLAAGLWLWRSGRGGRLFGLLSGVQFATAIVAIVAFISLYVYEHPHHHCPFCLLKTDFDYIGYALYLPLFAATGYGLAAGLLQPYARVASLAEVLPPLIRRHAGLAVANLVVFGLLASWLILDSNLKLIAP
jgi:cbb3-type cytochrome oxidase subunit 3